ncbi:protein FD-like [Phragmites australis]|uniref:protein FD-like n=1 Tax=Phragmites australis TaxID=29695 RepID=UPI002D7A22A3|nr:protein FD-like [Phragmites australis]
MEPQRGAEPQVVWGAGVDVAAAPASSARHALEQEVLYRAHLQLLQGHGATGDRRRERRIKNRESATRSRARRHAYMNELEKEVRLLRAENEQLKKLCEEVSCKLEEAAEAPMPVKRTPQLQRTSSAPF